MTASVTAIVTVTATVNVIVTVTMNVLVTVTVITARRAQIIRGKATFGKM